MTQVRQTD